MSVTVTNTTVCTVFYFAAFALRLRKAPDFTVYAVLYLK